MRNLAVVSSCSGGYGRWLIEWAKSIAAQTSKPGQAALIVHGDAGDAEHVPAVAELMRAAGIDFRHHIFTETLDLGDARNKAVALTDTEWVMHLDADDVLFPNALEVIEKHSAKADVVAIGYKRFGDLKAGPSNPSRVYSNLVGLQALEAKAPSSGVSPFRRSLWVQSPYRLGMKGAWDTALWIGFARLGARFVAPREPLFGYRQHGTSVFNKRRTTMDFTRAHVQAELHGLRKDWHGISVIIPFRNDGAERDRALEFVKEWYAHHHPNWEIVVGRDSGSGLWSKGEAIEDGISRAKGSVLIIADGDLIVDPETLRLCVHSVRLGAPWGIPHMQVYRLGKEDSVLFQNSERESGFHFPPRSQIEAWKLARPAYDGFQGGGIFVVRRDRWNAVGGIPPEFRGWGCEDNAIGVILNTMLGKAVRFDSPLIHLWHDNARLEQSEAYKTNKRSFRPYRDARGNPDRMWDLINPFLRSPAVAKSGLAINRSMLGKSPRQANAEPVVDTRAETKRIREEQQRRNIEASARAKSFTERALEEARANRLAARQK